MVTHTRNTFVKHMAIALSLMLTAGLFTTAALASSPSDTGGEKPEYTDEVKEPETPDEEIEIELETEIETGSNEVKLSTFGLSLPYGLGDSNSGVIQLIDYWDGVFYSNSDSITKNTSDSIKCAGNSGSDSKNGIEWVVENGGKGVRITFTKDQNHDTVVLNMNKYIMAFFYNRTFKAGDVLYADGTKAAEKGGNNCNVSYFLLKKTGSYPPPPEPKAELTITKLIAGEGAQDGTFSFMIYDGDGEYLDTVDITTQDGEGSETLDYAYGDYTVEEYIDPNDEEFPYDVSYEPSDGKVTVGCTGAVITVTNTLKVEEEEPVTGSITVFKSIEGEEFEDEEAESGEFTFIITDEDGKEYKLTVVTKGGRGQATLTDLPFGIYTVVEEGADEEEFPYYVYIPGDGIVVVDKENHETEVMVVNTLKEAVPSVSLSVAKHVRNSAGDWADSASYTANSMQVDFRIIVSLNVDELIAYNEENGTDYSAYVNGRLYDLLDGGEFDLPDDGEFGLYYNGEADNVLSKTFYISPVLTVGSHTNVVRIEEAQLDFFGGLKLANESDSAAVVISSAPVITTGGRSRSSGGTFTGSPPIDFIESTFTLVPEDAPPAPDELIDDEGVPLWRPEADEPIPSEEPEEIPIDDVPVPLVNMPQTGESNAAMLWLLGLCASLVLTAFTLGFILVRKRGKGGKSRV